MTKANLRARAGHIAGVQRGPSALPAGAALAAHLDATLPSLDSLEARLIAISDALPGGRIAFSTSLGLEDQGVLHAIAASERAFDVFTLDTGRHFPETLDTLEASELRYRLRY